jgi:PRTRC genetic system ThiF family protein
MTYFVRPAPLLRAAPRREQLEATIVLVGCGGTGGFVAEALARLLWGRRADLLLIDPDRVTLSNVSRQAFDASDVGRFKAEILAERLSRRFGRQIGYSVLPLDARLHDAAFDRPTRLALIVGAVDNAAARQAIAATLVRRTPQTQWGDGPFPIFWLDAGNSRNSRQILLGNVLRPQHLRRAFDPPSGTCHGLPAPSLQRPELLQAPPAAAFHPAPNCAESVADGDQDRTINQVMAAVLASYVERLLDGNCCWMATYIDLDNGSLQSVPAEPGRVASIVGVAAATLVARQTAA